MTRKIVRTNIDYDDDKNLKIITDEVRSFENDVLQLVTDAPFFKEAKNDKKAAYRAEISDAIDHYKHDIDLELSAISKAMSAENKNENFRKYSHMENTLYSAKGDAIREIRKAGDEAAKNGAADYRKVLTCLEKGYQIKVDADTAAGKKPGFFSNVIGYSAQDKKAAIDAVMEKINKGEAIDIKLLPKAAQQGELGYCVQKLAALPLVGVTRRRSNSQ